MILNNLNRLYLLFYIVMTEEIFDERNLSPKCAFPRAVHFRVKPSKVCCGQCIIHVYFDFPVRGRIRAPGLSCNISLVGPTEVKGGEVEASRMGHAWPQALMANTRQVSEYITL